MSLLNSGARSKQNVGEENHLINLLSAFDKTLALSYLAKVKGASDEIDKKGLWEVLQPIKDQVLVDPIAFRIDLTEPTFVLLSHPICRLRARVPYAKQIEWERFFVTQLGIIPIYLVNLNFITVLKLWGDDASLASSSEVEKELEKGDILLELSPAPKPAQYSSMNFVLRYNAPLNKAPQELLEPFEMYYRYLFWAFPGRGYTLSSHFLHRRTKITSFMKVTKSLYRISSIGNPTWVRVEGQSILCRHIVLTGFDFADDGIRVVRDIRAKIPEEIAQELEKKDPTAIFLNAMMTELKSELGTVNLLSNVVDIGEDSYDLTRTIMGLVAAQLYHETERPAFICSVEEFRKVTLRYLTELFRHIRLPVTLADSIDCFELALRALYPFIFADGEKIYYTHPLIIGFLARQQKLQLVDISSSSLLTDLIRLVEKVHDQSGSSMQVYIDPTMDSFKGNNKRDAVDELFSIQRRIMLYKALYKSFS